MKWLLSCIVTLLLSFQSFAIGVSDNPKQETRILIPRIFSPNGDGINETFGLQNITDERILEFKIFNKWGTIIYQSTNSNDSWDGTYKNQNAEIGVYGYVVRLQYPNGEISIFKGTVNLIR